MRHVRLEVKQNEEIGIIGFVPKIFSSWDSFLPGTQLGHDLIAHGRYETGSTESELKALGAEIWISDFYSRLNNFGITTNEANFAGDLENTFRDQNFDLSLMPQAKKYPKFKELGKVKEFFDKAWDKLLDYCDEAEDFQAIDNYRIECFDWIAYGFWYASRKRYRRYDNYDIYYIRDRINNAGKELKFHESDIGREFTLSYELSGYVEIKPVRNYYYE